MTKNITNHRIIQPNGDENYYKIPKTFKVWGSEHLIKNDEKYCVKIMTLEPETQVSLHYHMRKEETFVLISGSLTVETIDGSKGASRLDTLHKTGDSITLKPGTPHTFYCPDDQLGPTVFIEASTQDFKHDSYRIYPSRKKNVDNGGFDS